MKRLTKRQLITSHSLPPIPDKRYFSISEAERLCGLKAYVLRYWEQEFSQLRPQKRRGNRRHYQKKDILLVRQIRKLLYEDAFTIEGARSQLAAQLPLPSQLLTQSPAMSNSVLTQSSSDTPAFLASEKNNSEMMKKMIAELEKLLQNLRSECACFEKSE